MTTADNKPDTAQDAQRDLSHLAVYLGSSGAPQTLVNRLTAVSEFIKRTSTTAVPVAKLVAQVAAQVAAELAVELRAEPVAKVGYMPGHHENGLDVEIIDRSRVHDGMMLYAAPAPNATGETDREIALRFKREADALWHRVHEAEHIARRMAEYVVTSAVQDHFDSNGPDYRACECCESGIQIDAFQKPKDGKELTHKDDCIFVAAQAILAADDQQFDRNAERITREMGLGGGAINPNATSVLDLFTDEPDDRKTVLLTAAHALLKKQAWTSEVINLLSETVHYDGTECDGLCLISDIEDELGLDGEARPA